MPLISIFTAVADFTSTRRISKQILCKKEEVEIRVDSWICYMATDLPLICNSCI